MMKTSPTAQPPLRIGTRRSNLAIVQAEGICDSLQRLHRTDHMRLRLSAHWLEEKLTSGQLDVIMHCLKDMPTRLPDPCELAAIPLRDDPHDARSSRLGAVVDTSSVRRSVQLRRLYPHLRFANLRGNVETCLAKVDDPNSEYICMRVGLKYRINQYLRSKDGGVFRAVGQGTLGLEIRKGDSQMQELLNQLADQKSTLACLAERSLIVPIGVETEWIQSEDLRMSAIVVILDGFQSVQDTIDSRVQTVGEATALGRELAARLAKVSAEAILNDINASQPFKE
ncbi:putative porphobilinogen deaminase Hem3 [Aspergillus ruber CBS 135680]|uniref:hydroxymethylbilane synthase n=1 Tax=Aspergillus ruber (strain CBS 135680) TaxID=1388766 RepID=A0A017S2C4_ASPRC|nr:putative porphobilinogen deaminase Hem3 [Aspergillus ruber CBS 135680]EYE90330.1 putative porphobilinogen deaminase Hem3 [Aspergillus ruber CBS 135680]